VSSFTTIRSCGDRSAPVRTCTGWAANTPTHGITITWKIRVDFSRVGHAAYPWLLTRKLDTNVLSSRIKALRKVGVPYPEGFENGPAQQDLEMQSRLMVAGLKVGMVEAEADREIIALIAYLQRLGSDIKVANMSSSPQ
jgi:hypothetical protein